MSKQPKPCDRCAQMPYISPGFICHTEGCRWAITAEMIRPQQESDMAEKMTLEQVSAWHRSREVTFRRTGSSGLSSEHKSMADAIDAHLAQSAQAVDVGALNQLVAELTVYGSDSEKRIGDRIHRAIGNGQADD